MTRERKIVGLWPAGGRTTAGRDGAGDDGAGHAPPPADSPPDTSPAWFEDMSPALEGRHGPPWFTIMLSGIAVLWLGWFAFAATAHFSAMPGGDRLPLLAAAAIAPLGLLLLVWLIVERGSERGTRRHLRLLAAMRTEQELLADRLALIDRGWQSAQAQLADRADALIGQSENAAHGIRQASQAIEASMNAAAAVAERLNGHSDAAARNMDRLNIALPKVDDVARRAAEQFQQAGQSAYQLGGQLEERIAALQAEAADAERVIGAADERLKGRIAALADASRFAQDTAQSASERLREALDRQQDATLSLLANLTAALDRDAQALEQRLDGARRRIADAGEAQVAALAASMADAEGRAARLEQATISAGRVGADLAVDLHGLADGFDQRLAAFESEAEARLRSVTRLFEQMQGGFDALTRSTDASQQQTAELIGRVADYAAALEQATREVDEELPRALARLRDHVADSRAALEDLPAMVAANFDGAGGTVDRLREAEALLATHGETLAALDRTANASLASQAAAFAALGGTVQELNRRMLSIRDDAAPAMRASAEDAERAAAEAALRARAVIAGTVEESAGDMRRALEQSLDAVAGDSLRERIDAIAAAADNAVAAATAASDRLTRQLITLSDSSAAIESRVGEVSAAVESQTRESLARQMSLASEALNATAVDMTRLLSADVADQAWEAWLKGDRSIFVRRAVRLLNAAESREVLRRYQQEEDFRLLVNRYIHDFETMLRGLMDARDGGSLSVTLLSSDIGKVYVALAQAIERLRG